MDFLTDFKLHVILLLFPIIWGIGYVKAQGEYGVKSSCVVPQSYIGDTAIITCDFSVDLFKESKPFRMYRYDLTSSGRKNEQTVLECYFRDFGVPDCGSTAPGYEFNGTFNNQVTVTIPKATLAFQGRYECRAEPSYPQFIDDCVFLIIDRPATSIAVVGSSSGQTHDNENTDGTGKTAGIAVGSILFLAAVGAVLMFLLWKWNRIRLQCIKAKPQEHRNDEEAPDETSMRLLNQEQSTQAANQGERSEKCSVSRHEETTRSGQYTVAVDVDELNNQTEHDNLETECMAVEIDETKPVVGDSTEGEEHTATHAGTTPDSVDSHDSQSSTLGKTETERMILQDSAYAVSKDPSGKDQGPVPEVLLTTVDETTKNKEELERPASTPILCGKENPSGIDLRSAETSQLSFDRDDAMHAPQGAAAFAFNDKPDVSRRSDEATAAHGEAPNTTHMDGSIQSVQQPPKPSSDANQFRDKKNLQFHQNLIQCQPDGLYIDDIHWQWQRDLNFIDKKQDSIQWLFPTRQKPKRNPQAQELHPFEAEAIKADQQAFGHFLTSYKLMLNSFGLELVNETTGEVKSAAECSKRFDYLQKHTRNHMRLTRVLYCLGEMGLERYKLPLLEHILTEAAQGNLRDTFEPCRKHWIPTVSDSAQKEKLYEQVRPAGGNCNMQ